MGFVGLALLVLAAGAAAAGWSPSWYGGLRAPPWAPTAAVFGPVWTALDLLMALAAWLVWRPTTLALHRKQAALRAWGWQLAIAACWPPVFFGLHSLGGATALAALLVAACAVTAARFWRLRRLAAMLLAPYLLWVSFACVLSAEIWRLNAG